MGRPSAPGDSTNTAASGEEPVAAARVLSGTPPSRGSGPAGLRLLFGKERRLRKRADFLHVQQAGLRATSKHFVLLVTAGPSPTAPSRIGIVATKKVGDATMRNRIKRLCRECFRLWPGFVPDGVDLVVIAREGADLLTLDTVRAEWTRAHGPLLTNCKKALAAGPPPMAKRERAPKPAPKARLTSSSQPQKEPKSS